MHGLRCAEDERSEGSAFDPDEEQRERHDDEEHGAEEPFAAGDEGVERENVDDDGAENEEAGAACFGDRDEDPAKNFEGFDEGEIASGAEGEEESGHGRAFRGRRRGGCQVKKHDDASHNEEQAKQSTGDDSSDFHISCSEFSWLMGRTEENSFDVEFPKPV